jgi:hypothetical protein
MPRTLLRLKALLNRLACGKTKFEEDYRWHSDDDPYVPGTTIPRLKLLHLGERNIAGLEHELDALIDGLAKLRDAEPARSTASNNIGKERLCNVAKTAEAIGKSAEERFPHVRKTKKSSEKRFASVSKPASPRGGRKAQPGAGDGI